MSGTSELSASFPPFDGPDWTPELEREFLENTRNGKVGQQLVSETDHLRIWHIRLKPGERLPFHRHVNDYFWTALAAGKAKSRDSDGHATIVSYQAGATTHYRYGPGESRFHDLENVGDTELVFVTVEFLGGVNPALPID